MSIASSHHYLACDLGAESGRLMAGTLEGGRLRLAEVHRFANTPRREGGSIHWNIPNLVLELKEGLRKVATGGIHFESISTDSWGVDYILFDQAESMRDPVFHYRDPRTRRGMELALARTSWETIFEESGIQLMPINSLFQLAAEDPERLRSAKFLLGVGDAFNYFLSGTAKMEVSMASTFQLYNPRTRGWSGKLISALGFPERIFPEIVPSGSRLGELREELQRELGLGPIEVIATCSHDTGAAVAGVPATGEDWAYLSSGTWSLMGVELPGPVITEQSRELNFTNEIGYGGTVRFLKNISGLWLLQECRRAWAGEGRQLDYAQLTELAAGAEPFRSLIDPSSDEFLAPASMPLQIAEFCRRTGQSVPRNEGEFVRCALESLALLYRRTLEQLEQLTGRKIARLHIVGGGSNNTLLNQFAANATGIPVIAGPAEATAAGNILIQALALGHVASLAEAREIVCQSNEIRTFQPAAAGEWAAAAARFDEL